MTIPCRCGRCDLDANPNLMNGWAEPCYRSWIRAGRPADGPPPPDPTRQHSRGQPKTPAEPVDCACGRCGQPAVRPAKAPVLSEGCYRRAIRLGIKGKIPPPPRPSDAPRPSRAKHPRPPKQAPEPVPEAFGITDFRAAEVLRRIPGELARARGYAHAVARGDWLGADFVFARVKDIDAFDALLDAGLDIPKARAALAEQLTREFPDIQEETETAA